MEWVTHTTAAGCSARRCTVSRARAGSRESRGSSQSKSSGDCANACACRMSCCCPPESTPTRRSEKPCDPTEVNCLSTSSGLARFPIANATRSRPRTGKSFGNMCCCGMKPICPWTFACPEVSLRVPISVPSRVDLPTPLGPRTAMNSPGSTVRVRSRQSGSTAALRSSAIKLAIPSGGGRSVQRGPRCR